MRKKECHMIPLEEKKCIWMTAGLITYKLCTRDYRCEECIFDQVMRNEMEKTINLTLPSGANASDHTVTDGRAAPQTNAALFYHQNHCWVRVENPDQVRIGIDGILARLVAHIKAVALPLCGENITQDKCFAHIILARHILQLVAPVSGAITAVNPELRKDPQLIARDPWDGGWLVTVKPENLECDLRALLFGKKALAWYQRKEQLVASAEEAVLNINNEVIGPTLQDGGEKIACFVNLLSSEQFDQLIESLSQIENAAP